MFVGARYGGMGLDQAKRLWLNDGSCIRLRPKHKDHVWSYDFVSARAYEGRPLKILTLMDEYSLEFVD